MKLSQFPCSIFQLAQHNKDLAALLKPGEGPGEQALEYYAKHTAQIEVCDWRLNIFNAGSLLLDP